MERKREEKVLVRLFWDLNRTVLIIDLKSIQGYLNDRIPYYLEFERRFEWKNKFSFNFP